MFNENKTKWLSINFKERTMGRTKKSIKYEYNCYRFSNATKKKHNSFSKNLTNRIEQELIVAIQKYQMNWHLWQLYRDKMK